MDVNVKRSLTIRRGDGNERQRVLSQAEKASQNRSVSFPIYDIGECYYNMVVINCFRGSHCQNDGSYKMPCWLVNIHILFSVKCVEVCEHYKQ